MSPDWFTQVDFKEDSYEKHFQHIHDPQEGYDYIQYLNDNLDPGSDIYNYARVDLSRAVMQYTEEFLIYFLSYINTEDDFVEDLIRNQVRDFCDHYTDGNPDEYFEDASFQFDDRLKAVFGYDEILEADDPASRVDADLTSNEIKDRVHESVENIGSQLNAICRYYYEFIDIYNSIKHGNKFQLSPQPEIELYGDYIHQPEQAFATFLCKRSGDTSSGRPYLSNYPLDRLVDRSLTTADLTHTLFSYMDTIVEDRLDENPTQTRRFFLSEDTEDAEKASDSDDPGAGGTVEIWNQDSKTILPQTEELAELVSDSVSEAAMRMTVENDTIHVRTKSDSERSDEYPLMGSVSYYPEPGPRLNILFTASFNFNLTDIDICQYFQLLKYERLAENDDLTRLVIEYEDEGIEVTEPIDEVDIPVEFLNDDYELYEQLALAQKIAQTQLPLPPAFLEGQTEVIRDAVGGSPEQNEVIDAIEEAQAIGEDGEWTEVVAESASEERNLEPITNFSGFVEADLETADGKSVTLRELASDSEYGRENPRLPLTDRPGTYEQFLKDVENLGTTALFIQRRGGAVDDSDETYSAEVEIDYKTQTFWYDLHRIFIRHAD